MDLNDIWNTDGVSVCLYVCTYEDTNTDLQTTSTFVLILFLLAQLLRVQARCYKAYSLPLELGHKMQKELQEQ